MFPLRVILQVIVAFGLLNVWLLRYNKNTEYRGGNAQNMRQEFAAYGLPGWLVYVVGTLKVASALLLLVGIWYPAVVLAASVVVGLLMIGALIMHFKIGDPIKKSLPAFAVLVMCAVIGYLGW